jgi:hypothetical protein
MRKPGWTGSIILSQLFACLFLPFALTAQMLRSAIEIAVAANLPATSSTSPTAIEINPAPTRPAPHADGVNLFLHLDKSIYQPQETIWFTGYILNRDIDLMLHQNTLYVLLIDAVKKTPVLKQRFQIKNGVGEGFLSLPDSITAGDYWFIGYTNALLETGQQPLFRKLITVRSAAASFWVNFKGLEEAGDSVFARYAITTEHLNPVAGGRFSYTVFDSTKAILTRQTTIDSAGQVVIPISTEQDFGNYRELATTITFNGASKELILPVITNWSRPKTSGQDSQTAATVTITSDNLQYHQRSKVTLHIQVRDSLGRPVVAMFSLAVASSGAMRPDPGTCILNCEAIQRPQPLPESLKNMTSNMPDSGYVLLDEKNLKRPVTLALMGNNFASLQTDSAGKFALPYSVLTSPVGGVTYISVADRSPDRYRIVVNSLMDQFADQLSAVHFPIPPGMRVLIPDPDTANGQSVLNLLKAAVVKARFSDEYNPITGDYDSKHCDQDFVCLEMTNSSPDYPKWFLNCPENHGHSPRSVTKPKEGQSYLFIPKKHPCGLACGVAIVTYHCAAPSLPPFIKILNPILGEKPFPFPYTQEKQMLGTGLQSTVYWQHKVVTDANGEATVEFYTNDLTGKFTCLLQGVSQAGVIQGTASYTVSE